MNSVFSFVVGLLTAALSLLGFVQQHPELPQASRDQAQQIAQQAITQATQALTNMPVPTTQPQPPFQPQPTPQPLPPQPILVPQPPTNSGFSVSPTSGASPLAVTFSSTHVTSGVGGGGYEIDFGDGSSAEPLLMCGPDGSGMPTCGASITIQHTYASAGSYTTALRTFPPSTTLTYNSPHTVIATQTITVTGSSIAGTPSATIDQSSLSSSSILPTLSGTAVNTNAVAVVLSNGPVTANTASNFLASSKSIPVINGHWSVTLENGTEGNWNMAGGTLNSGSYNVSVFSENGNGTVIASGILVINAGANPSVSLTANGASTATITNGSGVMLVWNATNASSCTLAKQVSSNYSGGGVGALPPHDMGPINTSGSTTVFPSANTQYWISCSSNNAGNVVQHVDVTVSQ